MESVIQWQSATPMPGPAKRSKDPDWERKQRLREYRVAARREKRNRKADEKKQRKLNATILRRMTRNPDKYTKNAERNRLRAIDVERRSIQMEAVRQAQELAAIHDPTGAKFNVGPVVKQEDGTVISLESIRRREERAKEKEAAQARSTEGALSEITNGQKGNAKQSAVAVKQNPQMDPHSGINPARMAQMNFGRPTAPPPKMISKSQQKKLAKYQPRPAPPKPVLPEGISVPEGEENWIALWDLPDEEVERRVIRAKRQAAAARKALRTRQQSGKVERRAARDEKRKVYRDLKHTWKSIKEEEKKHKTKLNSAEDEEAKKIAVRISTFERKVAMDMAAAFGFTLENTEGVNDIKPRALGLKGMEVDFDALKLGDTLNDAKPRDAAQASTLKRKRVDLSAAAMATENLVIPTDDRNRGDPGEFIKLDVGEGQDFEALAYNHKLRRKLRRAIEAADVKKELLVRERAIEHLKELGLEPPEELSTPAKPIHLRGDRALEDGTLETAKAERVRLRLELAEFNKAARVLRKQAKEIAMTAGLRVHAEMTGKIPPRGAKGNEEEKREYGDGWVVPEEQPVEPILRAEDVAVRPGEGMDWI